MKIGNIVTTPEYWDCECEENYIHPIVEKECPLCNAIEEEQPESRFQEVYGYKPCADGHIFTFTDVRSDAPTPEGLRCECGQTVKGNE